MADLFEYLKWRGDLPFDRVPLGEVDNLIFSLLSYVKYQGVIFGFGEAQPLTLREAVETYDRIHYPPNDDSLGVLIPSRNILRLFRAVAATHRFGDVQVCGYVDSLCDVEEKQFAAVTFLLPDETAYVAFRGTDDTIVGWKEDFNMSYHSPIPSQLEATAYLNRAGHTHRGALVVGGHSKGGNLAVYAGVHCLYDVKSRITTIYNNDGPGFDRDSMYEDGYREICHKIKTYVPAYSVVGMLFERLEDHVVVRSRESKIMQHDGFSWEVEGGSFLRAEDILPDSKRIDRTMKDWVASMSKDDREAYVNAIYELVTSTQSKTLSEISRSGLKLLRAYLTMDPTSRDRINETTKGFLNNYRKNKKLE